MSEDFSLANYGRHGASHPNPTFDFLTGFAPRKLKDLFRWVEYLFYNSPQVYAAVKKFAEYAVTEVKIDTQAEATRKAWTKLLKKQVKVKANAIATGLDVQITGNSFLSVYKPFDRFLVCGDCNQKSGIKHIKYTFQLKTLKFKYTCPACHKATTGTISDVKSKDVKRIALIRWDAKLMDINYNPLTGASEYYYTIPGDLRSKVERGDKHIIDTTPIEFLRAMQEKKTFKFADGQIYHMKMPAPAGIDAQWGLPPLTSTIKLFFYAAVLRKANEAIALDHIVPFRVLHPAPISGTADPAQQVDLSRWQSELEKNIKLWRRDPLHMMFAPVALGVTTMGGQGRSLMTIGEIKDAEDNIILAQGIPREFLAGGLSSMGSSITLRMLENQLETYTSQQNDQLEWIIEQVASILGWEAVEAHFIPFKLIDDTEQKQLLLQAQQITGGALSRERMFAGYDDIDIVAERKRRQQEALDDARSDMELQSKQQKMQNSISVQADQAAQQGGGMSYNPNAVVAQADQLVQQWSQLDEGTRRSQMDHLAQEDPVMSAVVKDRMQAQATQMKQQAVAQMAQQGQA